MYSRVGMYRAVRIRGVNGIKRARESLSLTDKLYD